MEDFTKRIALVQSHVKELLKEFKPIIDGSLEIEKKAQFNALEESLQNLKRLGNDVPEALINLKNELEIELEEIGNAKEEYSDLIKFFQDVLKEEINVVTINKKMKEEIILLASYHKDFIKTMVDLGIFESERTIRRNYENVEYSGKIMADGTIRLELNGQEKDYLSFHDAAHGINEMDNNGLKFWRTKSPKNTDQITIWSFLQ